MSSAALLDVDISYIPSSAYIVCKFAHMFTHGRHDRSGIVPDLSGEIEPFAALLASQNFAFCQQCVVMVCRVAGNSVLFGPARHIWIDHRRQLRVGEPPWQ